MATSRSVDFNQTRSEIIKDSLLLIGAIAAGETPSAEETDDAARALNRMVKAWQAKGVHLWSWREATLFLEKGTVRYLLSTASDGDRASLFTVKTELSADAASGATSISVDSITGFASGDDLGGVGLGTGIKNIGIEQDDGTLLWAFVSGTPSGTTIALDTALTDAASTDNHVYGYKNASKLDRPLRVTNVRRRDEAGNDIPILTFSRSEYFDTPNKTTESKTTQIYYDPQLSLGVMYLWPAPDDVKDRLLFDGAFPLEDFDAAGNNPDFPQEWLDALVYGLGDRLAPSFGVPLPERQDIRMQAREFLNDMMDWDVEPEPTYFQPDLGWG